jgi:nucleotide-binding universal stress UspA family protein
MKTVFIAVDFSAASIDACKVGIELAEQWKAKVILFHAFKSAVSIPEAFAVINSDELKYTAEKELQKLALKIIGEKPIKYEVMAADGDPVELILRYIQKYEDPLVVCGLKLKGKLLMRLFGDVITGLLTHIHFPMLVVPEGKVLFNWSKIVFATDFHLDTDIRTLSPILSFAKLNSAQMSVLRIMSTDAAVIEEMNYRSERITDFLSAYHPDFVFLRSDDVSDCICKYIKQHKTDLLVMITKPHSFLERVFDKSETRTVLHELSVPLLLLPEITIHLSKQ